jgi:hypothetical protein
MSMLKTIISKIGEYLKYPSTSKGIIIVLGLIGVNIEPEFLNQILLAVGSIVAIIEVLFSDADVVSKKKK